MGTQNSAAVADNGIQNLNRSDIITVQLKKESYYEGQVVEGLIIFEPKQNIVLNDILIKFHQSEYFVYVADEKTTISDLNSFTFFEKAINAGSYLNMNPGPGGMIQLQPGSYKIPFQFTLPNNIPPSFEYPFRNRRASLRYIFTTQVLSPYEKTVTESYIWIKARPINIPDQIKHENYVTVKNVGIVSRGKSGIAIFTMANNYRINDMLPFTIDIYNEDCGVQVKEVKISIKRTVTFVKDGKEYQQRTAILRKRYPCLCDKNSKNSFRYDDIQLRDNEFKDADYNRSLNPYPFIDDLNLLMPNIRSKFIKCEYSLKATSYFDLSVFGKNRPRVEMPIYVTHQLQKEFEYEKNTNQYNGQGQEFAVRDFNRGFSANSNNPWENNNNNNNNNNWGNNNNNNNNNWGNNNNNNNWGNNNNNNNWGNNNNNNNNQWGNDNRSKTTINSNQSSAAGSKKYSYEAYIASKNLNNPNQNNNKNNWQSKSMVQPNSNFGNNNSWENNNNNPWGNNNNNNRNNDPWGNNNNNRNNDPWGNNNNNNRNNNPWENNNNRNNDPWGNNNNRNNDPWGNNNNNNRNNNPWGNSNNGPNRYGPGNNGSANPFGGGSNDFPSLDKINSNNNGPNNPPPNPFGNNNQPPNPFGSDNNKPPNPFGNNNNNQPPNPFGNNNNPPPNPFGNNNNPPPNPFGNNDNQPSNPFGGNSGPSPYQNSYPGF